MTDLEKLIQNYTNYITDQAENKWEVIEVSDLEEIIEQAVTSALQEAAEKATARVWRDDFDGTIEYEINKESILSLIPKEK